MSLHPRGPKCASLEPKVQRSALGSETQISALERGIMGRGSSERFCEPTGRGSVIDVLKRNGFLTAQR